MIAMIANLVPCRFCKGLFLFQIFALFFGGNYTLTVNANCKKSKNIPQISKTCYNTNMKKKKDIHEFIKKRKHLIWWTKNWDGLDDEAIVEAVLNYGDWDDVQELFDILGIKRVAEIFREQTAPERMRCNYRSDIKHYFNLYFNKHA